jgi:hypothetical protein
MNYNDNFVEIVITDYDDPRSSLRVMTIQYRHWQSGVATSDLTWRILRGKIMTKQDRRKSKSAQSIISIYMGQAHQFQIFFKNLPFTL